MVTNSPLIDHCIPAVIPVMPLFVIDILSTPPVANLIVSAEGNVIPVLLSVPAKAGAETDPSTPEIPVVPLMF